MNFVVLSQWEIISLMAFAIGLWELTKYYYNNV